MKRVSVIVVALMVLTFVGLAWAQQATPAPNEAMEPPVKQLEAFRRGDFDTAYAFASAEIKEQFDRGAFEQMVKGGYPEIARSASASIVGSILAPNGLVYLTLKIRGSNGKSIEALYELVLEEGKWKINGVRSRPDPGQV
jgi:hypothetical protein